ncbi:MAG: hypothetical protein C4521_04385 [Actinobacteria bacterium]|nr:MAG: hypothetical protein C4521_04385 [Actinomycetota bacterium]
MKQNEKIIAIVAAVVAVVAVVTLVMLRSGGSDSTIPDASQQVPSAGPGGMGSQQTNPEAAGKPTMVPKGMSVSDYVTKAYTLVKAKKYKEAFKMYPPTVQASGFESFNSSRTSMPVTSFKVGSVTTKGDTATVPVTQVLGGQAQNTKWTTTWTFEKQKNGQWGAVKYDVGMTQ